MGEAISLAINMVDERKNSYREHGIAYYRPWIFLITDGEPNDHWKPVISRVKAGEEQKAFSFFAVGVEGARMEVLEEISVRKPLWLAGHEVPRDVQLAVKLAAGGVPVDARR